MIARLLKAGKWRILICTLLLLVLTTVADWATGNHVSLAALYILPMMLGAVVLRPAETAALAVVCSYLRSWFDVPGSTAELVLRFVFAVLAYFASGLFVTALIRNREQALWHFKQIQIEQELRQEAEEQLRVLAETSPAAILTVDAKGTVLAANDAANRLFMIGRGSTLRGRRIGDYLPSLNDALRLDADSVGLRTAAQCQGHRDNGEIFLAHTWFSAYLTREGRRLAAVVVDSSEEMREREEQGLRELLTGNRIATAAIAHEVRHFCEAMAMLCEDLRQRKGLTQDEGLRGLDTLVGGLEAIASLDLQSKIPEVIEEVPLKEVLDNLRIVVEPNWREIDGAIQWDLPERMPLVWGDSHGLLQAFLNVAQNSHRAVKEGSPRELKIQVAERDKKVIVKFQDSGPGVGAPEKLFQPFQAGAVGSGLGLYVSAIYYSKLRRRGAV